MTKQHLSKEILEIFWEYSGSLTDTTTITTIDSLESTPSSILLHLCTYENVNSSPMQNV